MADVNAIRRVNPPALGTPPGYSQIVEVATSRLIFISGQTATDADGNILSEGDFPAQADQVFANLAAALGAVGCTPANLVKLTVFVRDMENLGAYRVAQPVLFDRHAGRRASRDARRGVTALWTGILDRDRGNCGRLNAPRECARLSDN